MKRVGITGSSGFLGGAVLRDLSQDPAFSVVPLDARATAAPPTLDWVLHFGAKTSIPESLDDPLGTIRANLDSTLNAVEMSARAKAALLCMSSFVYRTPSSQPISEEHPLATSNPYMASKLLSENACRELGRWLELPVVILRGFSFYGPGLPPLRLLGHLLGCVARGEPISLNDPAPRRGWLHVDDFVALVRAIVERPPASGTYNVGSPEGHSNLEVAELVRELAGEPRPVLTLDRARPGDVVDDATADIGLARRTFGWEPRISLRDGLGELVERARGVARP